MDEVTYINLEQCYLRQPVFAKPTICNVNNFPAQIILLVTPLNSNKFIPKNPASFDEEMKECYEAVKYYPCIYHF